MFIQFIMEAYNINMYKVLNIFKRIIFKIKNRIMKMIKVKLQYKNKKNIMIQEIYTKKKKKNSESNSTSLIYVNFYIYITNEL